LEVANTLAYYDTATITAVKKFYSTGPWTEKVKVKIKVKKYIKVNKLLTLTSSNLNKADLT